MLKNVNGELKLEGFPNGMHGCYHFRGTPKYYKMGYMEGFPHVEIECYKNEGVTVHYIPVGITFSWLWEHKEEAWAYANDRKCHINDIKTAGNEYANAPC